MGIAFYDETAINIGQRLDLRSNENVRLAVRHLTGFR